MTRPAATNDRTVAAGSAERTNASPTSAASKPCARQRRIRSRVADAGLRHDEPVVRHEVAQPRRHLGIHLERPQVAVVQADDPGAARDGRLDLGRVVGLDERLEPDLERSLDQSRQRLGLVEARQEQDEVRAGRAQHRELDLLDDELLGEDRDADRGAHGPQVRDRTAEPVGLAQHRDDACAPPAS